MSTFGNQLADNILLECENARSEGRSTHYIIKALGMVLNYILEYDYYLSYRNDRDVYIHILTYLPNMATIIFNKSHISFAYKQRVLWKNRVLCYIFCVSRETMLFMKPWVYTGGGGKSYRKAENRCSRRGYCGKILRK